MKHTLFTATAVAAAAAAFAIVVGPAPAQQAGPDGVQPGVTFLSNWDADGDGMVTLEELRSRRAEVFAAFDADEDGALNAQEFQTLEDARLGSMQRPAERGNGAGRGASALSAAAMDADADGSITLSEYLDAATRWRDALDRDGDGALSAADFGRSSRPGRDRFNAAPNDPAGRDMMAGRGGSGPRGMGPGGAGGHMMDQGRMGQSGYMGHMGEGMGQGRSKGGPAGKGQSRGAQGPAFEAFPTADGGLWIVDARTGDILYCRAVESRDSPPGFAPHCAEASF